MLLPVPDPSAPDSAGQQVESSPIYPSSAIKARLEKRVKRRSSASRWFAFGKLARWTWASAAASIVLLVLYGLFPTNQPAEPDPVISFIQQREPEAVSFVLAPDSLHGQLLPGADIGGWGEIWLNVEADEALMLMEGLTFSDHADYQVWAVIGNRHESLGLFKKSGSMAHLHARSDALQSAVNISFSEEPRGGSPEPTTHKTILYILPRR